MPATEVVLSPKQKKRFREVTQQIGGPDSAIMLDLWEAICTRQIVTQVGKDVFEAARRYAVDVVPQNDKSLTRDAIIDEFRGLLGSRDVSWIDTDTASFDWTDIHSQDSADLLSKLSAQEFKTAYVGIRRTDGHTDYLTYAVTD